MGIHRYIACICNCWMILTKTIWMAIYQHTTTHVSSKRQEFTIKRVCNSPKLNHISINLHPPLIVRDARPLSCDWYNPQYPWMLWVLINRYTCRWKIIGSYRFTKIVIRLIPTVLKTVDIDTANLLQHLLIIVSVRWTCCSPNLALTPPKVTLARRFKHQHLATTVNSPVARCALMNW